MNSQIPEIWSVFRTFQKIFGKFTINSLKIISSNDEVMAVKLTKIKKSYIIFVFAIYSIYPIFSAIELILILYNWNSKKTQQNLKNTQIIFLIYAFILCSTFFAMTFIKYFSSSTLSCVLNSYTILRKNIAGMKI